MLRNKAFVCFLIFPLALCTVYPEVSNLTHKDPQFPFNGQMYSGFIVVDNETQANMFYHLYAFNETTTSTKAPLIIWLQGGPGCSSMIGDFMEFGPVLVFQQNNSEFFQFQRNSFTWNKYAHLLFIDNPTGTGFSVDNGLNVSSTPQAAILFNVFLSRFYQVFPELQSMPLYIFGESYGGKYVPYFTYYLLNNQTFSSSIQLKGMGLGDGWSDPLVQVRGYSTLAWATGLIDQNSCNSLKLQESQCVNNILNQDWWNATYQANNIMNFMSEQAGNISQLDYREYSDSNDFGEDFTNWLNSTGGQSFMGVPEMDYQMCNSDVSDDFYDDNTESVAFVYPYLFNQIPVLFYNGQDDDNCVYEGVSNYINNLDWSDVKNFRASLRKTWYLNNGSVGGKVKSFNNVTFLLVYKAGHMVPYYQPEAASEMVYTFLNNIPFY